MARPIFTPELADADFSWLLTTFKENHPEYHAIEISGLPVVMFKVTEDEFSRALIPSLPSLPVTAEGDSDEVKE
jgi:hypothetical protein